MIGPDAEWLATLPGWDEARVTRLDGGRGNRTWKLDAGDRAAVLKLGRVESPAAPATSRATEAALQAAAARSGLAAPVLWHSPEGILTAWLDGDPLSAPALCDTAVLVAVGDALRRLHALPASGVAFDLPAWADYYRRRLEAAGHFDTASERQWQRLKASELTGPPVFSHNDPVPGNLVLADSAVRFIDWEYAGDNSPWFDLAVVISEAELGEAERAILLDAYLGDREPPAGSLDQYLSIYRDLVGLWAKAELPVVP